MLTFIETKLLFSISVERIKNGSLFEIKKKIRPVTNHNDIKKKFSQFYVF
jgi:hypothetical protein